MQVPGWAVMKPQMVPDWVTKDPHSSPVWEITGAEFSQAELHTAAGISIRFPRVTRVRDDKTWQTATTLSELKHLFNESKNNIDIKIEGPEADSVNNNSDKKRDTSSSIPDKKKKMKNEIQSPVKKDEIKKDIIDSTKVKYEYDAADRVMMSGEDANPAETRNMSTRPGVVETASGFKLEERKEDLFSCPLTSSLAHCISRDCRLGKGIAKLFRDRFGRVGELERQRAGVGELAVLQDRGSGTPTTRCGSRWRRCGVMRCGPQSAYRAST